jgi:hypothetical protein
MEGIRHNWCIFGARVDYIHPKVSGKFGVRGWQNNTFMRWFGGVWVRIKLLTRQWKSKIPLLWFKTGHCWWFMDDDLCVQGEKVVVYNAMGASDVIDVVWWVHEKRKKLMSNRLDCLLGTIISRTVIIWLLVLSGTLHGGSKWCHRCCLMSDVIDVVWWVHEKREKLMSNRLDCLGTIIISGTVIICLLVLSGTLHFTQASV